MGFSLSTATQISLFASASLRSFQRTAVARPGTPDYDSRMGSTPFPYPREARRARSRTQRLVEQILATVRAMETGNASIGDLKIVARALEEMRIGFEMFAPYRGTRKVATFGSARTQENDAIFRTAERFAAAIADAGFMIITGAGGGIMEACQRDAGRARSFGVNIRLPFEQVANRVIHGDSKLISFNPFRPSATTRARCSCRASPSASTGATSGACGC
jgi:SLOG cluster4 family